MCRRRNALIALALLVSVITPAALATTPEEDLSSVFQDWKTDGDIKPCRFTTVQLQNARNEAKQNPDFEVYGGQGFVTEIDRELARNRTGVCRGVDQPSEASEESPLADVRIVRVRQKGGARKESVTLKNRGERAVNLRRATLRDKSGKRIRFPRRGFRLKAGRKVRVVTGCPGRRPRPRRPVKRKGKLYGCRKGQLWNARSDVARLKDRNGVTVSQRGYGRYKRFPRF